MMDANYFQVVWILLFVLFFLPVLQQKFLMRARKKVIQKLEESLQSRVIVLVHRQELLALLGLPLYKFISVEDSEQILRAIYKTEPEKPIDLIVHTPGGLVLAASQIAKALHRHPSRVRVMVPHYAMSGGSLLAFAADEIVMHQDAVLGPVDPQVFKYPAVSILKAVERKPISEVQDETLILADQAEKALQQVQFLASELLSRSVGEKKAGQLAKQLSLGTWTHDYPITFEEAQEMGLKVSNKIPEQVMELMELYPQPTRRQPNVEYSDEPRRVRRAKKLQ